LSTGCMLVGMVAVLDDPPCCVPGECVLVQLRDEVGRAVRGWRVCELCGQLSVKALVEARS
jgi:hypothetical protein